MIGWWIIGGIILLFGLTALTGAPYVPSRPADVRRLFAEGYVLSADDVVLDIGSGDGLVLREAARSGATVVGYEINPLLVLISRWRLRKVPRAHVYLANSWWRSPLPKVTVMYTFGDGRDIGKMFQLAERQAAAQHSPVTFISYAFAVPQQTPIAQSGGYFLYRVS